MNLTKILSIIFLFLTISLHSKTDGWEYISKASSIGGPICFATNGSNLLTIDMYKDSIITNLSTDQGKTWKILSSIDTHDEFGKLIRFRDGILIDNNFIFGTIWHSNSIIKSSDGGINYELVDIDTKGTFYEIAMFNRYIGILLSSEEIYVTNDGWKTFKKKKAMDDTFYYPKFKDDKNVELYLSRSGSGKVVNFNLENLIFTEKSVIEDIEVILDIEYLDNGKGFMCGLLRNGNGDRATDILYRSDDDGKSWTKIIDKDVEPQWGLDDIAFNDTTNGFIFGQLGKIVMTNDGGNTWDYVDSLDFYVGADTLYGPFAAKTLWLKNKPYILTLDNGLYTYNGDYYKTYNRYSISGSYMEDGYPVYGRLQLGKKIKYSYDSGDYIFEDLNSGTYTVVASKSDYYDIKPDSIVVKLDNENVENINFEVTRKKYNLTGLVNNEAGADLSELKFSVSYSISEGIPRSLDTLIGLSDLNGFLLKEVYANKNFIVKPVNQNNEIKVLPSEYNIALMQDTVLNFDVLKNKDGYCSMRGQFLKANEGIHSVRVALVHNYTGEVRFTHTDSNGYYKFDNLAKGDYSVFTTSVDMFESYIDPLLYTVKLDSTEENLNFEIASIDLVRFFGRVVDKNGIGVPNVIIHPFELFNPSSLFGIFQGVKTKADGTYATHFFQKTDDISTELTYYTEYRDISTPESYSVNLSENQYNLDFVLDMDISNIEEKEEQKIALYPNPASDKINIELINTHQSTVDISIINELGKVVNTEYGIYNQSYELDISALPAGFYIIRIEMENTPSIYKTFIKK